MIGEPNRLLIQEKKWKVQEEGLVEAEPRRIFLARIEYRLVFSSFAGATNLLTGERRHPTRRNAWNELRREDSDTAAQLWWLERTSSVSQFDCEIRVLS